MEIKGIMFGFIQEVRAELLKVTWPTRAEVIRLTGIVILISIFIGVYLGALDALFTKLLGFIL